ncbi:MAG: hypothetical protein H7836_04340 [Magnetococcus sp. YQC-3]
MKITTYSLEELSKKGWKYSEPNAYMYLGDARYPTKKLREGLFHLLGKTFAVECVDDKGRIEVIASNGDSYLIPDHVVKTPIKNRKINKTIYKDEVVIFNGYNFKFPCSMSHCSVKEARRIAQWILKVGKQ